METEEYYIRKKLTKMIDCKVSDKIQEYISKYGTQIEYYLYYPLIDIETGLINNSPEHYDNYTRRAMYGTFLSKTAEYRQIIKQTQTLSLDGFNEFKDETDTIFKIYADSETSFEVKDSSSYAKSKVEKVRDMKYKLTTSFVEHQNNEAFYYFYGKDDEEAFENEILMIESGKMAIYKKYYMSGDIEALKSLYEFDYDILAYSKKNIQKDLGKLSARTKSSVFTSIDKLINVLSLLFYIAFIYRMHINMLNIQGEEIDLTKLIIEIDYDFLLNRIEVQTGLNKVEIEKILKYLINDGNRNILEFPLFCHNNMIVTIPSLLMVNDWQFTIVNGHFYKDIEFIKMDKTISLSTQNKLKDALVSVQNTVLCEGYTYSFINSEGKKIDGEIDFGIYDLTRNVVLIMEAKWKYNHYRGEQEVNHIKIQDTLNKIFKEQIKDHCEYLSNISNIHNTFNNENRIKSKPFPRIFYLAIDKRNQLHLNNMHMIAEFMLLFYIRQNCIDNELNLVSVVNDITSLTTRVTYINVPPTKEINIDDYIIEVDECDLQLSYN